MNPGLQIARGSRALTASIARTTIPSRRWLAPLESVGADQATTTGGSILLMAGTPHLRVPASRIWVLDWEATRTVMVYGTSKQTRSGVLAAETNHTIEDHSCSGDGRCSLVSVWTSALHDVGRVVSVPLTIMPYFKFHAEHVVEARSEDEAKEMFASDSWNFAADAKCERLPKNGTQAAGSGDVRERVLVTVRGGVADAFYDEARVMVEIFDYDEYAAKGKDPEPYLDDLVRDWGFPDPRKTVFGAARSASDTLVCTPARNDQVLYKLVAEDAQAVAEKELGRTLTDDELRIVEHEIGEYIDWDEAMTFCLRQQIAGEL